MNRSGTRRRIISEKRLAVPSLLSGVGACGMEWLSQGRDRERRGGAAGIRLQAKKQQKAARLVTAIEKSDWQTEE